MPQTVTDGALAWQTLAAINKHERDDRIQFEEESHTYTIDGTRKGWTSCTGFLHNFFGHFDPDAVISKMMTSPNWPSSEYYGMTAATIKKQWADKGTASSIAGTRMHLDIEHFYNTNTNSVEEALTIMDAPTASVEWDYFIDYQRNYAEKAGLKPFRTEWLIFDEEHKVAGSIDMVYLKPDGTLAIYDWKRVEKLKTDNKFQSGFGPVAHLPDTNYWHYSLQLNVYRYILEKHYGYRVSELALVILHPTNQNWRVAKLNVLTDEIAGMMATRAAALRVPGNDGSKPVVVLNAEND